MVLYKYNNWKSEKESKKYDISRAKSIRRTMNVTSGLIFRCADQNVLEDNSIKMSPRRTKDRKIKGIKISDDSVWSIVSDTDELFNWVINSADGLHCLRQNVSINERRDCWPCFVWPGLGHAVISFYTLVCRAEVCSSERVKTKLTSL